MPNTTLSASGQLEIPEAIRDQLNWKPGTEVALEVEGDHLIMKRRNSSPSDWRTMRGMFRGSGDLLDDLAAERAAELAHDDDRLKGS